MRRLVGALVATAAIGAAVPVVATATTIPGIAPFVFSHDGVRLPAGGRGAVAVVVLPNDPVGPGSEYEALSIMGVPATVVNLGDDLSSYRVAILAGAADAGSVNATAAAALSAYVDNGGVLIGEAVTAPALRPLFGIRGVAESSRRETLTLCAACHPSLSAVTTSSERAIELDDSATGTGVGTVGYVPTSDAQVLGRFADGNSALLARPQGRGTAYAVGARLLDLVTRHWEGARFSARRTYANTTEADTDAWLLWLRGVWRTSSPGGVTLSTMPTGVRAQVLLTLSANWGDGMLQTPQYLRQIRAAEPGAEATVFAATRTVEDWLDDGFFPTPSAIDARTGAMSEAAEDDMALGAELGSHSVSHTPLFGRLGNGTGNETFENYAPFIQDRATTNNASLLGELLVSRGLLRQFQPDVPTFRAPYLLSHRALAPAEDEVGYLYDSSTTQGWVQTAFPFHPPRLDDRGFADVVSFPITVEDEAGGGLRTRMDAAVAVAAAAIDNGAPATILIHPRADATWRGSATTLISRLRSRYGSGLSVDSIGTYGTFWSQRDRLALKTAAAPGACGGQDGVRIAVANRGATRSQRQSLSVADRTFTQAAFYNRHQGTTTRITDNVLPLPDLNPGRSAVALLCP